MVILVDFDVGGILTPPGSVDAFLCCTANEAYFCKGIRIVEKEKLIFEIISVRKNQIYERVD